MHVPNLGLHPSLPEAAHLLEFFAVRTLAFAREAHCERVTGVGQLSYGHFLNHAVVFGLVPPFLKKTLPFLCSTFSYRKIFLVRGLGVGELESMMRDQAVNLSKQCDPP